MSPRLVLGSRFAALGGLLLGLAISPLAPGPPPVAVGLALAVALIALRPPRGHGLPWLALVCALGLALGLKIGSARITAIDARALEPPPGVALTATGTAVSTPRVIAGSVRFTLALEAGRVGVEVRAVPDGVDEGRIVAVSGRVREAQPWEAGFLAREGATRVVAADRVVATAGVRSGLRGALDAVRRRAELALGRGTPDRSAALLRGFVLGQDDRIADSVREEFRRSGLAHLLAVSGQNVMLLAILATPVLALLGVPLRMRLVGLIALIGLYVPVAGAGPSIQRAGVMGAAGLIAALASRPRARWYALLLAAAVTLAIDPRATGDVGWQLSFAAVAALLAVAAPLARMLAGTAPGPARRLLAEGGAMTIAATAATAPLAAHHFGTVSLTALPANLIALPAVAPAMWLGMLAGAVGQIRAAPAEPLTWLGGLCAGFIAWVARVLGGEWAQAEIAEPGLVLAVAVAIALVAAIRLGCRAAARRGSLAPRRALPSLVAAVAATVLALHLLAGDRPGSAPPGPAPALRIRVLDVGQGDAILLEPRAAPPVLVDTGPPGSGATERLLELGIARLGAVAITHDQRDHSGALAELLSRVEVESVLFGRRPELCAPGFCPGARRVSAGDEIRSGRLRLDVLWPSPGPGATEADPNARSLVLRAGLGGFDALLAGDAEAELAAVDPGVVDVLKVAHHGSADAGLGTLLGRSTPRLALISVGSDNAYGHPAPETLAALAREGIPIRRTDSDGEIVVEVRSGRWTVE